MTDEPVNVAENKIKAVITEIAAALHNLVQARQGRTLFINKMGLTSEEQEQLHDILGKGDVTIRLANTAEPAEWQETRISGVWYGRFFDQKNLPLLETIEIGFFPEVAAAQEADIAGGLQKLGEKLTAED